MRADSLGPTAQLSDQDVRLPGVLMAVLRCCAATLSLLPSDPAALAIAKYTVAAVLAGSTVMLFGLGLLIAAIQEE